jgi:AcrR family transcriptional regulator
MSRRYSLGKRRAAVEETRTRVIESAARLIAAGEGLAAFSLQAVARDAGVARMTVYHQFRSRRGLVAAVMDGMIRDGLAPGVRAAFDMGDPDAALDRFVRGYCDFWRGQRPLVRGIRGLAGIDAETGADVAQRDQGRRLGLTLLLGRQARLAGRPPVSADAIDLAWVLTGFAVVDGLLDGRDAEQVAVLILAAIRAATTDGA